MKKVAWSTVVYAAIVAIVCIWSLFDSRLDHACEKLYHLILPIGLGLAALWVATKP